MADTTVYQQVTDLMKDKPELEGIKPVMLVLASGQDRTNNLLQSTRRLLGVFITTSLTLTVAFAGLILQLAK